MSFVPVTGPATFRPAEQPRESVVEFSDARRTVELPIRAALPVLTKSHARQDLHPSVGLLSGAVLLAMRLVAAGKLTPGETSGQAPCWRIGPLDAADRDRVSQLAQARACDDLAAAEAHELVGAVLDAVADAMPRTGPPETLKPRTARGDETAPRDFTERLRSRLARHTAEADLPQLVRISLRVEADEEELVAGAVRLVLQVHDERDPLHVCDAAALWTDPEPAGATLGGAGHGFGSRARTHATIALRAAAEAWPVLDRLLALAVPDEITLDTDELVSLLDVGVAALRERGVDVLWPRSLGRDLTATTVLERAPTGTGAHPREEPLHEPLLGGDTLFAFNWQLALHGEDLTPEEMDRLASAASPILELRGSWTVVDPAVARKARKRLIRTVEPAQAMAAALTGTVRARPATPRSRPSRAWSSAPAC